MIASTVLEVGEAAVAIIIGGVVLLGVWAIDERLGLPRWVIVSIGAITGVWMISAAAPDVLAAILEPLQAGLDQVAPIVFLGGIILAIVVVRRWRSDEEVVLQVEQ